PTFARRVWLGPGDRWRGEADHVEGADQVHGDHARERVQRVWSVAADGALRQADAGAVDRAIELAELAQRRVHGSLDAVLLGDIGSHVVGALRHVVAWRIDVGNEHARTARGEQPRTRRAEPRRSTADQ